MTQKEVFAIKKAGRLVALAHGRQYWLYDGALYYIGADGSGRESGIWCPVSRLAGHLRRLQQVTGKKHFTDDPEAVIIDRDFIACYIYA